MTNSCPSLPRQDAPDKLTKIAKFASILLASYWAIFALVAPTTIWDSMTYNLARLPIAHSYGFFGHTYWNSERQACFPWTFDAIHWPFVMFGWGMALPSFFCFLGTTFVAHEHTKRVFGERSAWFTSLVMFSMPTLIYQAVSTKNDIPIVFAVACWFHAVYHWIAEGRRRYLTWIALSLGFLAGVKSSGVLFAFGLGAITVWVLRKNLKAALVFFATTTLSLLLLGSVEVYLNNMRLFGSPLGPVAFIQSHQNHDGLAGALANFIRYHFGAVNLGWDVADPTTRIPEKLANMLRWVLETLHLTNKGSHGSFPDSTLRLLKDGGEAGSDYGVLGMISLFTIPPILFLRKRDSVWWLAVGSWGALITTSATTAWMPWNARFLLLTFVPAGISLAILCGQARQKWIPFGFVALAIFSAVTYPVCSKNKRPREIMDSIINRESVAMSERKSMLEVVEDLRERKDELKGGLWLAAGSDSWVLPVYMTSGVVVHSTTRQEVESSNFIPKGLHGPTPYLLVLNLPGLQPPQTKWRMVKTYKESDTSLYALISSARSE